MIKELPRPIYSYDPRPELWECQDGNMYLMYVPYVVTSPLVRHGKAEDGRYECVTRRSIYVFDWCPTLRGVSRDRVISARILVK